MVNQTVEARYIKKSVLEDLLSGLFDPGYTVEVRLLCGLSILSH
jgi:hypothetical protein